MDTQRHFVTTHRDSLSPCHVSPRSLSPRTTSSCLSPCLQQKEKNAGRVAEVAGPVEVRSGPTLSPCHHGTAATCHREMMTKLIIIHANTMNKLDELREVLHYIDEEGNELYRYDLMALLEVVYSMMHKIELVATTSVSGGTIPILRRDKK